MEKKIIDQFYFLSEDKEEYLYLNTGINSRFFSHMGTSKFYTTAGLKIYPDRTEDWVVLGSEDINGKFCFFGEKIDLLPFPDMTLLSWTEGWNFLKDFIKVLEILKERNFSQSQFYTYTIRPMKDGGFFVLPSDISERMAEGLPRENWEASGIYVRDNLRNDEESWCYTLAMLTDNLLRKERLYKETILEDWHSRVRSESYIPLPEMNSSLGKLVRKSLNTGKEAASLQEWSQILNQKEDPLEQGDISFKEIKYRKQIENQEHLWKWKCRIKKHSVPIIISCLALLIAGLFISAPLKKAFAPPQTAGMVPREIVETYYSSFNILDEQLAQDCFAKGVDNPDQMELINVYVISRMRLGTERKTGMDRADEWWMKGRPELEAGNSVYGVADLHIKETSENHFTAEYVKIVPGQGEEGQIEVTTIPPVMLRRTDTLVLDKDKKGYWGIISLEREEKPVNTRELVK